eukprot:6591637-Prymnesium_polylepis.1
MKPPTHLNPTMGQPCAVRMCCGTWLWPCSGEKALIFFILLHSECMRATYRTHTLHSECMRAT